MTGWIDELAGAVGESPLTDDEAELLLAAAREVAHRVERKATPLAAFLLGGAVARAVVAEGASRADALAASMATLRGMLPNDPARA